ncbi:MAG: epoxyqueuosine reductase QueH [Bacilli bacterium]|nr:epoxyqueuosine reductase QueH [Bacilli bacterium]
MERINYDKMMMEEISKIDGRKKLLLHSCCGPCSTTCIERLKDYFDVTVIYYNPNIEPREEYEKRKSEQLRYLGYLGIPYLDCDYDNEEFREKTKCLSKEKEGGKRCSVCFGIRLKYTARMARDNNFDMFTTTLTVSPHKDSQIINRIGIKIGDILGIKYLPSDFKKNEGYKRSIELASNYDLYRQNYCGCLYSRRKNDEE